jgi:hypothetical protein
MTPRMRPLRWRFGAKRFGVSSVAFHVDGQDLVHVHVDADGKAVVIVFESSAPDADVIFTGRIDVSAHPSAAGRPAAKP